MEDTLSGMPRVVDKMCVVIDGSSDNAEEHVDEINSKLTGSRQKIRR